LGSRRADNIQGVLKNRCIPLKELRGIQIVVQNAALDIRLDFLSDVGSGTTTPPIAPRWVIGGDQATTRRNGMTTTEPQQQNEPR
jgi:hypothetical protein